jgi:competence protein ComEA
MDLSPGQKAGVLLGLCGILLGLVALTLNHARQDHTPLKMDVVIPPVEPTAQTVTVYVVGAVNRPGVYQVPARCRVGQAIGDAGGMTPQADPVSVNLAAFVEDGQQIVVKTATPDTPPAPLPATTAPPPVSVQPPATPVPAATPAPPAAPSLTQTRPISLSRATQQELETLPGVGPALAMAILYYRQQHGAFRGVSDLLNVPGFGPERVEAVRQYVVP